MNAIWRCGVCETVNHGGRTCAARIVFTSSSEGRVVNSAQGIEATTRCLSNWAVALGKGRKRKAAPFATNPRPKKHLSNKAPSPTCVRALSSDNDHCAVR